RRGVHMRHAEGSQARPAAASPRVLARTPRSRRPRRARRARRRSPLSIENVEQERTRSLSGEGSKAKAQSALRRRSFHLPNGCPTPALARRISAWVSRLAFLARALGAAPTALLRPVRREEHRGDQALMLEPPVVGAPVGQLDEAA